MEAFVITYEAFSQSKWNKVMLSEVIAIHNIINLSFY